MSGREDEGRRKRPLRATAGRRRPLRARPAKTRARSDAPLVLDCREVSVRFGGLQALSGVDLEIRRDEIVGLIGPNGAGKTTLMECISGFQALSQGRILYTHPASGEETELPALTAGARADLGIGR